MKIKSAEQINLILQRTFGQSFFILIKNTKVKYNKNMKLITHNTIEFIYIYSYVEHWVEQKDATNNNKQLKRSQGILN